MKTFKCLSIILLISFISLSCKKSENDYPLPCIGDCTTNYKVVYLGDTLTQNQNGIWEIEYAGLNYFQVSGKLSELNERYVVNGVPLIEANFDSDYWVLFDTLRFQIPMYSYLGWFNDQSMNTPISIGSYTYTMVNLIDLHPPLNIVGYQIPKYFCWECPYAPTIVGVHSKYNYRPTCNVLLDDEMIGDTINLFVETIFNTDLGFRDTVKDNFKIIIK
jgi:hypothetical protein